MGFLEDLITYMGSGNNGIPKGHTGMAHACAEVRHMTYRSSNSVF